MKQEFDIVGLGELLVDFTFSGKSQSGMGLFEQNPGGAPANLLTVASHMGLRTAFVGKVGKDMHGEFLIETLKKEEICTDYIVVDDSVFTTLAFVGIDKSGEREFSFARKPGADTMLREEELDEELLTGTKVLHVGSLSLTNEPAKSATYKAIKIAKKAKVIISYDPNYRASLWENENVAVTTMKELIPYADLMKVSEEESELLTGEGDYKLSSKKLLELGPCIVAVTLGEAGVYLATKEKGIMVPGFKVNVVDTTGAGDSFWGAFLSGLIKLEKKLDEVSFEELIDLSVLGNATASLCVQKRGGIPAIPKKEEVEKVLACNKNN